MNKKMIGLVVVFLLALSCSSVKQSATKTKQSDKAGTAKSKPESKYDKLFKDKKPQTAKGNFITLHKMDGKVYFELPLKYMGREILFGTTISSVTEPSFMTVGMKNSTPIYFRFALQDSSVVMKTVNTNIIYDKDNKNLSLAIRQNYRDPSLAAFKIEAYSSDSSAVVFDMTSFVGKTNPIIPVVPKSSGVYSITATPKDEMSFVKTLKSFDDNVSVKTDLNYSISATIMGIVPVASDLPFSAEVTHTFLLLPQEKMTPRVFDSRIGVFATKKTSFPAEKGNIETIAFANRWRLVPKDTLAYGRGELTEPAKPIVFYVDNTFPEDWKKPVKEGILRWNNAFEKIGFKNAVQVRDFPTNDPGFDPDNLKYSCVRYIPNTVENAEGPYWTDPSTGEIINASVLVYNNIEQLLYKWRFTQTANVDASVRNKKLPKNIFDESLSYVVAHETGHTLGFMHNMAASSAYPTDSLRSASFTQKYGITPSIMDYARFNYVAQPQDKGVKLTPPDLGVYDYYVVDWNYRYFPDLKNDVKKEAKELEKLVDAKSSNPMFRYAAEQASGAFDPSFIAEDLGDDPIKSSNYGIKNLKNISANLHLWIKDDEDSSVKNTLNLAAAQQFHRYLTNGLNLVGGICLNEAKESSATPRYKVVSKAKQREALLWAIDQIKNFKSYANPQLEKSGFINVSYYDQLLEYITADLFRARGKVILASHLGSKSYSQKEFFEDVYAQIFKSTFSGVAPSHNERFLERFFVENALALAEGQTGTSSSRGINDNTSLAGAFITLTEKLGEVPGTYHQTLQQYRFGTPGNRLLPGVNLRLLDQSEMYFYGFLLKLKPVLENKVKTTSSVHLKSHYQFLLFKVEKALKDKK